MPTESVLFCNGCTAWADKQQDTGLLHKYLGCFLNKQLQWDGSGHLSYQLFHSKQTQTTPKDGCWGLRSSAFTLQDEHRHRCFPSLGAPHTRCPVSTLTMKSPFPGVFTAPKGGKQARIQVWLIPSCSDRLVACSAATHTVKC